MVPAFASIALAIHARSAGWLRGLKPLPGLLLCLLLVAPWFVLIMIATNGAFLSDSLGADMMSKVASGQEAHGAPPGSYLAAFFLTGWPMAPLTLLAAPFIWRTRRESATAFLLAWLVPAWLLFEAVPTKLPHYVLPLFPALAILTAAAIEKQALALGSRLRHGLWLIPGVAIVLLLVGLTGTAVLGLRAGLLFYVIAPAALWQAWRMACAIKDRAAGSLVPGGALLAIFCYVMVYGGVMSGPVFQPFAMSPRLAEARARAQVQSGCPDLAPASPGYREPSLVFLTRTDILFDSPEATGRFMGQGACRIAFVSAADEPAFQVGLGTGADGVKLVERLTGINLNGGRKLDIGVYLRQGEGR
jgi:4-amino-4-deoxy-L-arabinose transferase-like glycosyltransferase